MTESASKNRSVIAVGVDKHWDWRFEMKCEACGGFLSFILSFQALASFVCCWWVSAMPWGLVPLVFAPLLGNQCIQIFPYCLKSKKRKLTLCLFYFLAVCRDVCGTCHEGCASPGGRRGCVFCQTFYQPIKQMNCSVFISVY